MQYYVVLSTVFVGIFVCFSSGKDGELNEHCQLVQDCRPFAYYCGSNRTCQCISYSYRPNKYWDKCVGTVGQRCKYDEHCIEGAYCKEQKLCECKEDLVPNEDRTECSHSTRSVPTKYVMLKLILVSLGLFFG